MDRMSLVFLLCIYIYACSDRHLCSGARIIHIKGEDLSQKRTVVSLFSCKLRIECSCEELKKVVTCLFPSIHGIELSVR